MTVLAFAASLRKDSFNRKLIHRATETMRSSLKLEVDLADFREFEMPVYDGDLETSAGIPEGALKLAARLKAAAAVVISTPEYNGGIPGAFKNAIDWVSRQRPNPWDEKPILLMGASPGALGAIRGLWHSRVPLEAMGAFVHPEMLGIARAAQAFTPSGEFTDLQNQSRLEELLRGFADRELAR